MKTTHEKSNGDGTHDIRIDDIGKPTLWQITIENGKLTHTAWIDEQTDEAITGIPDDENVYEALEEFARTFEQKTQLTLTFDTPSDKQAFIEEFRKSRQFMSSVVHIQDPEKENEE